MRLIDGDELLTAFPVDDEPMLTKSCVRMTIQWMPTVDAVPVVRCKDCVRFRPDDDVWGCCTVSGKMRLKDYCSYGVKDGDDNGKT